MSAEKELLEIKAKDPICTTCLYKKKCEITLIKACAHYKQPENPPELPESEWQQRYE